MRSRRDERERSGRSGPPEASRSRETHSAIDAFELFCAYHLGITAEGGYRFQNVHDVAKRFGTSAGAVKQALQDHQMDADTLVHSGFDFAGAQVDIMVAPEGVDRVELARALYEAFRRSGRRERDWARELRDDARANEATYGSTAAPLARGKGPR